MYHSELTLDDLLHAVFSDLLSLPVTIHSTRGRSSEVIGAMLRLENPLARLSQTTTKGTPFSAIGELLWYLSGSDDVEFIAYYIKAYREETVDGQTVPGAYGPRLFHCHQQYDQVKNVLDLLRRKQSSRQAVIQLFDASDLAARQKEVPCTCTMQLLIRENKLQMVVSMRSNDAYRGLPHDVFAFTMLQELFARELNIEVGTYTHLVASLHLYEEDRENAKNYLSEGYQSTKKDTAMPAMPGNQSFSLMKPLLQVEKEIREGNNINVSSLDLDDYWKDIIRLLQVYYLIKTKNKDENMFKNIINKMTINVYNTYIYKRIELINRNEKDKYGNSESAP